MKGRECFKTKLNVFASWNIKGLGGGTHSCWIILPPCYPQLTFIKTFKLLAQKICRGSYVLVANFQSVLQAFIPKVNQYRKSYFQKAQVICSLFVFRTLFQLLSHRANITGSKTTSFHIYTGKRTAQHFSQRYKDIIALTI